MERIFIHIVYLVVTFATLTVPTQQKTKVELFPDNRDLPLGIVDFKSLSPDRMLVTVNDTIYMLNAEKEIVWEASIFLVAPPIVDSTGTIYGICQDLGQFSINAMTGAVSYFGRNIGGSHAYYTQIQPYKGDQYLVVENRQFYRDGNLCYPKCPMTNDGLFAWSGEKLLWSTDFPPNAELHVSGDKIFALTKEEGSVVLQEIELPRK
ncbi:MAG TPA: hypothetical protein VFS76_13065 [Pyrinomonadaceae bacterium]|nr:hypothetical protein [Pyrinomonadaceae bacterium]